MLAVYERTIPPPKGIKRFFHKLHQARSHLRSICRLSPWHALKSIASTLRYSGTTYQKEYWFVLDGKIIHMNEHRQFSLCPQLPAQATQVTLPPTWQELRFKGIYDDTDGGVLVRLSHSNAIGIIFTFHDWGCFEKGSYYDLLFYINDGSLSDEGLRYLTDVYSEGELIFPADTTV